MSRRRRSRPVVDDDQRAYGPWAGAVADVYEKKQCKWFGRSLPTARSRKLRSCDLSIARRGEAAALPSVLRPPPAPLLRPSQPDSNQTVEARKVPSVSSVLLLLVFCEPPPPPPAVAV
uniref:Uncharacterized protein n=1 Tax=Plectus sambesii TaxID=2011161 RepID=A0A914WGA4_9BILA